jgi:hypothetical protein
MNIDALRKRFEIWKYLLFINLGASVTLFLQAILNHVESPMSYFQISWYGVWFVVQLASFLPGFVILWGKHWVQIPLHERLNTIFGYFVVAWITLLPIGLRMGANTPEFFNYFFLGCASAIAIAYYWLRRKSLGIQNEIFP